MQMQNTGAATSTMPTDGNHAMISGHTIQGTRVFNPAGEELGHIDDVMIDSTSGRVVYGVLQFGGFLGIGSAFHAIPFGKLRYDAAREGYVSDLTKDQLEKAPKQEESWLKDRDWQQRSHEYYGVAPYWI